jgi:2-polyprenyl-3-methyl-5-hydroxy-6-metoxy-1,4-benzoquinol methylase
VNSDGIDPGRVKDFWEGRGAKIGTMAAASLCNLEQRPEILEDKVRVERECMLSVTPLRPEATLLDLGAGVGQWSLLFAPRVHHVVAVEYVKAFVEAGRAEAARRGISNLHYVNLSVEDFRAEEKFDVVFISGLLVYLTDPQAASLVAKLRSMLKDQGVVVLREPTSVLPGRFEILDKFSEALQTTYSALYRTADEYRSMMGTARFLSDRDGDVFPDGSSLNKFPETRLRYYVFR